MARLGRYFLPNQPLHVIQRGNNRQAIFLSAGDAKFFAACLHEAMADEGLALHAYVFMTNHIHLLASPATAESLPRVMQNVGRRYVRYFNTTHERSGSLWEGRYRATVIAAEDYFFACSRYIEMNPVRAGLCAEPGAFRWSSYNANALGKADPLITPHQLYTDLSPKPASRSAIYRALFVAPLSEGDLAAIRQATHFGWALGSAAFREAVEDTGRRSKPSPKGRPRQKMGSE